MKKIIRLVNNYFSHMFTVFREWIYIKKCYISTKVYELCREI